MHFSPELIDATAWALLHFLWQGALVGLAYHYGRRMLGSTSSRLALGQVALLAMVALPIATVLLLLQVPAAPDAALNALSAVALPASATGDYATSQSTAALAWIVMAWAVGVALLGLRATGQWMHLRRLCRLSQPAPAALQSAARAIAARMGVVRPVALRVVNSLASPIVIGFWRPVVVLPMALALSLPVRQLELLIAHELAHVKRWDYLVNLLQNLLEIVLFYHPAVHWVSSSVRQDREHACDELVAGSFGSPLTYARALLAAAEAQQRPAGLAVPHLAVAATGGVLLPRIERILGVETQPARRRRDRVGMLAVAAAMLVATITLLGQRDVQMLPLSAGVPQVLSLVGPMVIALEPLAAPRLSLPALIPVLPDFAEPDPVTSIQPLPVNPRRVVLPEPEVASLDLAPASRPVIELGVSPAPQPSPAVAATLPNLLRYVAPQYPQSAIDRGIEGEVQLGFRISSEGRPIDVTVLGADSVQEASLVEAARNALKSWRFDSQSDVGQVYRRTFEFNLSTGEGQRCEKRTGSRLCR